MLDEDPRKCLSLLKGFGIQEASLYVLLNFLLFLCNVIIDNHLIFQAVIIILVMIAFIHNYHLHYFFQCNLINFIFNLINFSNPLEIDKILI